MHRTCAIIALWITVIVLAGCLCCSAQEPPIVALDITQIADGTYVLTIAGDIITVRPIRLLAIGTTPGNPPVNIPPPNPTTLAGLIQQVTAKIPDYPEKSQHASSLAVGYEFLSGQLRAGKLDMATAASAADQMETALLGERASSWADWQTVVDVELGKRQTAGLIVSAGTLADAYDEMADGLRANQAERLDIARIIKIIEMILQILKTLGVGQ